MRVVDVFVQQRTARVERPLTYAIPNGTEIALGDVVRVPLGPRELYGYAITAPREAAPAPGTRELVERVPGPRVFRAFRRASYA